MHDVLNLASGSITVFMNSNLIQVFLFYMGKGSVKDIGY